MSYVYNVAMHGSLLLSDPGGILILAGLTAFVAGLMRGFAGFGSVMLMAPIFAILFGPVHMVPLLAIIEAPMGIMLFLGARQDVEWKFIGPMTAIAAAAMPFGIWLLISLDTVLITKVVSLIVLLFVFVLVTGWNYRGPRPLALTLGIGGFSGAMMATTAIGGPPVLLYMLANAAMSAAVIRANIVAYYLLTGLVLIAMFTITSSLGAAIFVDAILLTPILLLSSWIGSRLADKAAEKTYRSIAFIFLTIAGLVGLFG